MRVNNRQKCHTIPFSRLYRLRLPLLVVFGFRHKRMPFMIN